MHKINKTQCIWFTCVLLISTTHILGSVEEGIGLQSIKGGLQNYPKPLNTWVSGTDPCKTQWYGVTCANNRVTVLNLSNLGLDGTVAPDTFTKLPGLTQVLLGNNSFTGSIPESVFGLSNLTHFDISYNRFSGTLSKGFERLTNLQVLSLTGNPFKSAIEFDFSPLSKLKYILLADCGFVSNFPTGIMSISNLYALDLENNYFSGKLPDGIWRLSNLGVLALINSGLSIDLRSYVFMKKIKYLSVPENIARNLPGILRKTLPSMQNSLCMYVEWIKCQDYTSPTPSVQPNKKKSNKEAIIGGAVGGAALLIAGCCIIIYCVYIHTRPTVIDFNVKAGLELNIITESQSFVVAHAFTYADLGKATNSFNASNLIGEGSFGQVFRGVLTNGKVVAIKRMDGYLVKNADAEKEFRIEVDLLSRLNHPNLVRLFGYCADGHHRLIVYEFLPNGSLESYFEGRSQYRTSFRLDFRRRLLIALGAAKGLAFLHSGGEDGNPVIHRDFKSSNILLDEYYTAKISDFGFAKLLRNNESHASTRVIGTFGYFDPHYTSTGRLTVKADVYSFGVVLLQLLTGKPAVVSFGEDELPQNIVSWCQPCLNNKRKLKRILDKDLGSAYPSRCANRVALLASCCLRENADARPTMVQCIKEIENILVECVMHLENIGR